MKIKSFFRDREFLKLVFSVALPISLQFLIFNTINMADTVMITSLGSSQIAAVGLVNQFVFFFIIVSFGVSSAGSVFFSQNFGNKNIDMIKKYLSIALQVVISVGIIFTTLTLIYSKQIMRILSPDPEVIKHGADYLYIIAITFIPMGISQVYNTVLRATNRAKEPLLVSFIALLTNISFNYVFIFGKFGAPALGVSGAAIGTLISRVVEIFILTYMINRNVEGYNIAPTNIFKLNKEEIKKFIPIAAPIIINELFWSLGQLLFSIAYARVGTDATASIQLTNTIQNVFFIIVNSVNNAASILLGQALGSKKTQKAEQYATFFMQISLLIGMIALVILSFAPSLLMRIYSNVAPNVYDMSINLLVIRGVFIPFRFINGMLFVGILRAGGETKIPMIIEILTMWVFAIPAAFIGVLVLRWPIEYIFIIVSLEEFIKSFFIYPLYRKKRWLNTLSH